MAEFVLDSSAVLAFILGEPGGDLVEAKFGRVSLSTANLVETATKLTQAGTTANEAWKTIVELPIEIVPVTLEIARRASQFARFSRSHGLSLGDRLCLATAQDLNLPVLTADREWSKLDTGVSTILIR